MKSLEYFFHCNVVDLPDQSHAYKCVSEIVWKAMGVYDFIFLMLITWNLPWSPDDESMRRDQLEEVLTNTYNTVRMEDCITSGLQFYFPICSTTRQSIH